MRINLEASLNKKIVKLGLAGKYLMLVLVRRVMRKACSKKNSCLRISWDFNQLLVNNR